MIYKHLKIQVNRSTFVIWVSKYALYLTPNISNELHFNNLARCESMSSFYKCIAGHLQWWTWFSLCFINYMKQRLTRTEVYWISFKGPSRYTYMGCGVESPSLDMICFSASLSGFSNSNKDGQVLELLIWRQAKEMGLVQSGE